MGSNLEVLSILVENHYGVLARIATLFGRRGYNINTITASTTNKEGLTRITITLYCEKDEIEQIVSQTLKLHEVQEVKVLNQSEAVMREMLLLKVKADEDARSKIKEATEIYKASVVDLSQDSMIIELTGKTSKIDGFIKLMETFEIMQMCRTGVTGMDRKGL